MLVALDGPIIPVSFMENPAFFCVQMARMRYEVQTPNGQYPFSSFLNRICKAGKLHGRRLLKTIGGAYRKNDAFF